MQIKTRIIGGEELLKALKDLPQELVGTGRGQKNVIYTALKKGAQPLENIMKLNAPVDTGRLKNAIKTQRHPRPRILNEIVGVGVDPGKSRQDLSGAYYGYIVEAKTGFMLDAARETRETSLHIITREIAAGVEKAAKKVGNENARAVASKVGSAL